MFRDYDGWKLDTPSRYDAHPVSESDPGDEIDDDEDDTDLHETELGGEG